jgi:hypothetical protein
MDEQLIASAAGAILAQHGWCVVEACLDVPTQVWDARLLVFGENVATVIEAVAEEIDHEPGFDLRLTGCCRRTLTPKAEMGAHLCYLAPSLVFLGDEPCEVGDDGRYRSDGRLDQEP